MVVATGSEIKLNLGSGTDHQSGFLSVDVRLLPGVDVVADVRALPFPDDSAGHILAQDVIEHLPQSEVQPTLVEWYRVLRPGGTIAIRTPNFYRLFRAAITRRLPDEDVFRLMFGDQSSEAGGYEYGGHKSGLSMSQWTTLLAEVGFTNVELWEDEHEFNLRIHAVK